MQTSSSTSASERTFTRSAITGFACVLGVLLIPYETLVRKSESVFGVKRANIAIARTLSPKVDSFIADVNGGIRYQVIAVGTSRVEGSLRPDILDPLIGPTYNLGLGGSSCITTLEFIERLGLRPSRIIVGVSPMDFTPLGVQRGQKGIARASGNATAGTEHDTVRGPAAWARSATYALIHSAAPERRRNLGQWLEFWREHGKLLEFLNNEDATGIGHSTKTHGYVPSAHIADAKAAGVGEWGNIPDEYASGRVELFPRLAAVLRRFQDRGVDVTLLRVPTMAGVRRSEDAQTHFDEDIRSFSRRFGLHYIDGLTLVGAPFSANRDNFSDAEHLNSTGAFAFSHALASALQ